MTFRKIVFLAIWLLSGSVTFGQTVDKKTLTLEGAERVIAAAKAKPFIWLHKQDSIVFL